MTSRPSSRTGEVRDWQGDHGEERAQTWRLRSWEKGKRVINAVVFDDEPGESVVQGTVLRSEKRVVVL